MDRLRTLKAEAEAQKLAYAQQNVGLRGDMAGCTTDSLSRESLLGRLHRQASHAQQEARRAERTQELIGLLEENPKLARIFDLVEELGGY